jgi:TusA-related sulfurtransferase
MLKVLQPGQILEVLGTDPLTLMDLPHILEQSGDQLIEVDKQADYFRMFLRRGRDSEKIRRQRKGKRARRNHTLT